MTPDFHSGKRLALARKLKGYTQEELSSTLGFPAVSIKTLRRWEQKGVNPIRLKEVADFFQLPLWPFFDENLLPDQFSHLILYPTQANPKPNSIQGTTQGLSIDKENPKSDFFKELVQKLPFINLSSFQEACNLLPPHFQDQKGWHLLLYAVKLERIDLVEFLATQSLESINLPDEDGFTPLMCAAYLGNLEILELLLNHQAKINHVDLAGWSALTWACFALHLDCLPLLTQKGADIDPFDLTNQTPLHRAVREHQLPLSKWLLQQGANPNHLNQDGESPLSLAIASSQPEMVQLLLQFKANPQQRGGRGKTPLGLARDLNNPTILKSLQAPL